MVTKVIIVCPMQFMPLDRYKITCLSVQSTYRCRLQPHFCPIFLKIEMYSRLHISQRRVSSMASNTGSSKRACASVNLLLVYLTCRLVSTIALLAGSFGGATESELRACVSIYFRLSSVLGLHRMEK